MLFALVLNLCLGASYFGTKKALEGLPELTIVFLRTAVAVALVAPLAGAAPLREMVRAGPRTWATLVAMGGLGLALPIALGNYGVALSSASNASLLVGVEPICITLFGALVLGERLTRMRAIALALGVAGATTVVSNGIPFVGAGYTPHLAGDLLLVAHGAAWAIYTIAGKPLVGRFPALPVTAGALIVALPLLLPLAALELPRIATGPTLGPALAWAIGLGVFASGLGTLGWNLALARMDASTLAGFVFLQPLAGVLLGYSALGEPLSSSALAGGALVLAGVYALMWDAQR